MYIAFILTHNADIAATVPAFLSIAAYPIVCGGMGVAFFLINHLSDKNRRNSKLSQNKIKDNMHLTSYDLEKHNMKFEN